MADLFDWSPPYPKSPGFKDRDTAKDAARKMAERAPTLRDRCLSTLRAAPATPDEVAAALDASILAVRPRISELVRLGSIIDTGIRRRNASGCNAKVYQAKG